MKITMIAGSNREGAASTMLLRYIERQLKSNGISVSFIDLYELPLPLFSPQSGELHPNAGMVVEEVISADGLVLATPEYHGSISGALKNALDYLQPSQVAGKTVLAVSSAGGPVGVGSLLHLQSIVRNLHCVNNPEWISTGGGYLSCDADSTPLDEDLKARIQSAVTSFVRLTRAIAPGITAAQG
ncbi:NADPH-dependent FMN reductase [Paenibacillus sp. 32352]|uniref:NADPH-dependent FMN reductase n=1 Tax=Paenibacillus sp. 32352 TaxID=1969111 RepID=UPI0009AC43C0|nr:NADPH-dependent FMN reductase [Paenibacillus sp. 32352]